MGKIAELLYDILKELKVANKHLEILSGKQYQASRDRMLR